VTFRKPIFCPTVVNKNRRDHDHEQKWRPPGGAAAQVGESFEGAMKVLMMRAPWESGAVSGAGVCAGKTGAVAMWFPPAESGEF